MFCNEAVFGSSKMICGTAAAKAGILSSHRDDCGRLVEDDPHRFGFQGVVSGSPEPIRRPSKLFFATAMSN
jgi:hypothetical protein